MQSLKNISSRNNLFVWLILFCFTFVTMCFVSVDSPFRSVGIHVDSAMFFMGGKAWALGMTPYVDFTDSKGPLLWLIEMIAYLISPRDYTGVWILSIFLMTCTFYVCFRAASLFLKNRMLAIAVAVTMAFPYFARLNFLETRAETWCSLPFAYGLYLLLKALKENGNTLPDIRKSISFSDSRLLGVALAACLLIKWSIAFMLSTMCFWILVTLALSIRKHRQSAANEQTREVRYLCICVLNTIIFFLLTLLPFAIYFLSIGAFDDLINEYFLNTSATVKVSSVREEIQLITYYLSRMLFNDMSITFLIFGGAILLFFHQKGLARWILPLCCLTIIILSNFHDYYVYYIQINGCFVLIGLIWTAVQIQRNNSVKHQRFWLTAYIFTLCIVTAHANRMNMLSGFNIKTYNLITDSDNLIVNDWKESRRPTIIYYNCLDNGLGMTAEILPGNKNWFRQNGANDKMLNCQREVLKMASADYIVAWEIDSVANYLPSGTYHLIGTAYDTNNDRYREIYRRNGR